MTLLPPHLQIEPIRRSSPKSSWRLTVFATLMAEGLLGVGLLAWLRARPAARPTPPLTTYNVELINEPSPEAAGGAAGTGTTDPDVPEPALDPLAEFVHPSDPTVDRPQNALFDPALPQAAGGDGRPQGASGTGEGTGAGFGIRGMGPGGLRVRIGDMEILKREDPVYPSSEMNNGIEDKVELEVTIDEHGAPVQVKVDRCKVPALATEAVRAIKQWRFAAVRLEGRPVRATFRMEVEFMISNKRASRLKA